jgi:hypothetical protein
MEKFGAERKKAENRIGKTEVQAAACLNFANTLSIDAFFHQNSFTTG